MESRETVVIGAGMAGIACARRLADAGRDVVVLDKGRGLGGRMASRRTEAGRLDHGAPWLEARGAGFSAAIEAMVARGDAAGWTGPDARALHVGLPGMSGALRGMAQGVERRQSWEVREVRRADGGWRVAADTSDGRREIRVRTLVSTVPAPQASALLGEEPGLAEALAPVRMEPGWTLLAVLDPPAPVPTVRGAGDVAWLSDEATKPGRAAGGLILQAGAEWSAARLELSRDDAEIELWALLALAAGLRDPGASYAAAHRWRHARTAAPLGRPFFAAPDLWVGGDWCLGPRGRGRLAERGGHGRGPAGGRGGAALGHDACATSWIHRPPCGPRRSTR